ncbi:MAG: hypothetical protein K940chlam5_01668 [Candidatus Anoxychlamydiales bacterium]|nr:hypothetical protein [Candidatus Anoxychlamydiales bacterium]
MSVTYNAIDPKYSCFLGRESIAHSHAISASEVRRLAALPRGRESTITEINKTIAKVTSCSFQLAETRRGSAGTNNYFVDHQIRLDEGLITNLNNLLIEKIIVLPPIHPIGI